ISLNSAKVIPEWIARYSGICLYLANSAAQSPSESGGTTPMTGFHSVIDSPESVSRVIPPTTIIRKINAQQANSHAATAPSRGSARAAPDCAVAAAEIDNLTPTNSPLGKVRPLLGDRKCGRMAATGHSRRDPNGQSAELSRYRHGP